MLLCPLWTPSDLPGGLVQKLHEALTGHKLNICALSVHLFGLFDFVRFCSIALIPLSFSLPTHQNLCPRADLEPDLCSEVCSFFGSIVPTNWELACYHDGFAIERMPWVCILIFGILYFSLSRISLGFSFCFFGFFLSLYLQTFLCFAPVLLCKIIHVQCSLNIFRCIMCIVFVSDNVSCPLQAHSLFARVFCGIVIFEHFTHRVWPPR